MLKKVYEEIVIAVALDNEYNLLIIDENLYKLAVENTRMLEQDPETILVYYESLHEEYEIPYLQPKVKIKVSTRLFGGYWTKCKTGRNFSCLISQYSFNHPHE